MLRWKACSCPLLLQEENGSRLRLLRTAGHRRPTSQDPLHVWSGMDDADSHGWSSSVCLFFHLDWIHISDHRHLALVVILLCLGVLSSCLFCVCNSYFLCSVVVHPFVCGSYQCALILWCLRQTCVDGARVWYLLRSLRFLSPSLALGLYHCCCLRRHPRRSRDLRRWGL